MFGEVNEQNVNDVIMKLMYLSSKSDEEITICINSGGGMIAQGLALIDAMNLCKAPIRTIAIGTVASMAAVIFICGTKGRREMFPSAKIMIHDPRVRCGDQMITTNGAIELGRDMKRTQTLINTIISEKTGKSLKQVNKDTSYDHFFNAQEAIEYGLCDVVATDIN